MASIKDVAEKARVSISTVSIIINGKSKDRKISEETQKKVLQAMKELNYQPNLSAQKLRTVDSKKTIALFWTTDFRGVMLSRFLTGLQNKIKSENYKYNIIIYPYENNQLFKEESLTKISNFHGAIIANASEEDLRFLDTFHPMIPIVLYNRQQKGYSSVYVDDQIISEEVFNIMEDKKNIGMVMAPYAFDGMKRRDDELMNLLKQNNQNITKYNVPSNDIENGYKIAKNIDFKNIDILFTASDLIGAGIIHYCYKNDIRIPNDIEIISIGNGLTHADKYLNPSLSIVEIPMEYMAEECMYILNQLFSHPETINKMIKPQVHIRESLQNRGNTYE